MKKQVTIEVHVLSEMGKNQYFTRSGKYDYFRTMNMPIQDCFNYGTIIKIKTTSISKVKIDDNLEHGDFYFMQFKGTAKDKDKNTYIVTWKFPMIYGMEPETNRLCFDDYIESIQLFQS